MLTMEKVQHFFSFADAFPSLHYWKDFDSVFLGANNSSLETLKLNSANDIIGKLDTEMPWHENSDEYVEHDKLAKKNGSATKITFPTLSDGSKLCLVDQKFAIYNTRNQVTGVFANLTVVRPENYLRMITSAGFLLRDMRQKNSEARRFYYRDIYFTKRQAQVAQRILLGHTAKEIAYQLSISAKSVESYLAEIKEKIDAYSRKQIVEKSFTYGFIDLLFMPSI